MRQFWLWWVFLSFSFVWASFPVTPPPITIHAQNSHIIGKPMLDECGIKSTYMSFSQFVPMFLSVVIDVVHCEKFFTALSAANTLTPVVLENNRFGFCVASFRSLNTCLSVFHSVFSRCANMDGGVSFNFGPITNSGWPVFNVPSVTPIIANNTSRSPLNNWTRPTTATFPLGKPLSVQSYT